MIPKIQVLGVISSAPIEDLEKPVIVMEKRGGWGLLRRNEEFQESEIWDVMGEREARSPDESDQTHVGLLSRHFENAAMMIPVAREAVPAAKLVRQSAPVDIPDWSKIYGRSPKGNCSLDSSFGDQSHDDDAENERVAPHEWAARKRGSSASVCEGVGRTLKGRDLRRVRDAVLTKTGFL